MATTIKCPNCRKQIQEDFRICPYCMMELDPMFDQKIAETDEDTEEYFEDDDIFEDDEDEKETPYNDDYETYYEDGDEDEIIVTNPNLSPEKKETEIVSEEKKKKARKLSLDSPQENNASASSKTFVPIDIKKGIKKPQIKIKKEPKEEKTLQPYEANHDHYYDDVLPEILDDIRSHTPETILKIIGCVVALLLIIWYLIYFI